MEIGAVIERSERVVAVRADAVAGVDEIKVGLRAVSELEAWLASSKAVLTARLADQVPMPEQTAADCTRGSTRDAIRDKERAATLNNTPGLAGALDDGEVTAGHVDALTNTAKSLDSDDERAELFDRVDKLTGMATAATVAEWRRRLVLEANRIRRGDGMDRLERQRRAARCRSWVDGEGMWHLDGRFDPVTGARLAARLDAAVQTLFAEHTPDGCPTDPIDKQHHLRALALARLICEQNVGTRPGRPEFVVVIDTSTPDGAGGPSVDWGIPVDVPYRVLADMAGTADVHAVVVRNGVVLHAPGELDLGRSTRLASPAQRRALRALYATCAIPGCTVPVDRCKVHHVVWWRNGGRTDLANLLPVCARHHTSIHDAGWDITLGPNRELTVTFPDGTIHNTGPPNRQAA